MTFNEFALAHGPALRLGAFFGVFAAVALWEAAAPRRARLYPRRLRWLNNLALVGLNGLLLRLVFPLAAVGFAALAQTQGWGLLRVLALPEGAAFVLSLVALDFAIYLQHVMFHAVPLLWRLHRVHHADPEFDVTTGARFHPVEILLSMLIKLSVVAALGAPAAAVLVFEILLNACAMFNHGNLRLPARLDRRLRWLLVTPDMHRVHHSLDEDEANSNFGFNLSWWDRCFGTYRHQPRRGHADMEIGLRGHRDAREVCRLPGMLSLPFKGAVTGYAIKRRPWQNSGELMEGSEKS